MQQWYWRKDGVSCRRGGNHKLTLDYRRDISSWCCISQSRSENRQPGSQFSKKGALVSPSQHLPSGRRGKGNALSTLRRPISPYVTLFAFLGAGRQLQRQEKHAVSDDDLALFLPLRTECRLPGEHG